MILRALYVVALLGSFQFASVFASCEEDLAGMHLVKTSNQNTLKNPSKIVDVNRIKQESEAFNFSEHRFDPDNHEKYLTVLGKAQAELEMAHNEVTSNLDGKITEYKSLYPWYQRWLRRWVVIGDIDAWHAIHLSPLKSKNKNLKLIRNVVADQSIKTEAAIEQTQWNPFAHSAKLVYQKSYNTFSKEQSLAMARTLSEKLENIHTIVSSDWKRVSLSVDQFARSSDDLHQIVSALFEVKTTDELAIHNAKEIYKGLDDTNLTWSLYGEATSMIIRSKEEPKEALKRFVDIYNGFQVYWRSFATDALPVMVYLFTKKIEPTEETFKKLNGFDKDISKYFYQNSKVRSILLSFLLIANGFEITDFQIKRLYTIAKEINGKSSFSNVNGLVLAGGCYLSSTNGLELIEEVMLTRKFFNDILSLTGEEASVLALKAIVKKYNHKRGESLTTGSTESIDTTLDEMMAASSSSTLTTIVAASIIIN